MDVHRSRFVDYPTSAISALAFSRSNDNGYNGPLPTLKLALGRANGDIEIWNPQRGLWVQETIFPGNNSSIDGIAWTQDPDEVDTEGGTIVGPHRLFSIASSSSVTEWDLATGTFKWQSSGNFSEVWCLAAQPRGTPKKTSEAPDPASRQVDAILVPAQDLVAGCGDGTIVLLTTADGGLQYKRTLARVAGKRARCMCITYQNRDLVVAGFADSMIRVFDTRSGTNIRTMSLGVSLPGAPKSALVWQIKCLPNGYIVSGDSNGEVRFWDGRTYSMLQRIHGHDSDCLDLVVSYEGTTVMSGSIDGKVAVYRLTSADNGRRTWARTGHRRVHSGEVKAMAAFDSKNLSMTVSGGSDSTPMVTPLREYGKENIRALPFLPHESPVTSAPRARLLVSWWEKKIFIWHIHQQSDVEDSSEAQKSRTLIAKINLDSKSALRSVSISNDGRLIAASTSTETKLFQLHPRPNSNTVKIRKLQVPKSMASSGARKLQFSPDGKWLLCVTLESEIYVSRIATNAERPKQLQVLAKVVELERRYRKGNPTSFNEYERTVTQVAFSTDSSVLVVSNLSGYMDSWVLEGHEDATAPAVDQAKKDSHAGSSDVGSESDSDSSSDDSEDVTTVFYGQHWADNPSGHLLPKLDAPPLVLSFRPQTEPSASRGLRNGNPGIHSTRSNPHAHSHELPHGQHRLFVLTSKHQMLEFDVLAGRLSEWSKKHPTAVALPEDFAKIRDRVMGAVWDVASPQRERIWLYGTSFVCMVDVGDTEVVGDSAQAVVKRKRKARATDDDGDDVEENQAVKRRRGESGAGGRISDGRQTLVRVEQLEDDAEVEDEGDNDDHSNDDVRLTPVAKVGDDNDVKKRYWCTFKYRPVLGMVPLVKEGVDGEVDSPLEVVIVERPLWNAKGQKVP